MAQAEIYSIASLFGAFIIGAHLCYREKLCCAATLLPTFGAFRRKLKNVVVRCCRCCSTTLMSGFA